MKPALSTLAVLAPILGFAAPTPTLKVGMRAPSIASATWIKGKKPASFKDGKVHVVEFWATWCAPCNMEMPDLSNLAREYRGRAEVDAIGVSELSHAAGRSFDYMPLVRAFVRRQGDRMAYNVGEDGPNGTIRKLWMEASGTSYIPSAFVVDRDGRVSWIGGSSELDAALSAVLDHGGDPEHAVQSRIAKLNDNQKRSQTAARAGDLELVLALRRRDPEGVQTGRIFALLREHGRDLATRYAEEIRSEPSARLWDLLDIAWCIVDDRRLDAGDFGSAYRLQPGDYALAVRLAETAIKRCDPDDELYETCLEDIELAFEKSGEIARAVEAEKALLAYMGTSRIMDYSSSIADAKKKLAELQAESSARIGS